MSKRIRHGRLDSVDQQLARLLDTPHLARIVPHLSPETIHQLLRHRGLDACGELVAAATREQLASVLDLDLWHSAQPARDDTFDEARFGEWVDMLADAGGSVAGHIIAAIDANLLVTGLARYIRVFDVATFEPTASSDDESINAATSFEGNSCEVGGYVVRARRTDGWEAIVALLLALETDHPDRFHALMQGCRRLSNSTPEIDGLDDLFLAPEQMLHEVSLDRETRRSQQGYLTPADARAFLQMARQPRGHRPGTRPTSNPIAAAYFRDADQMAASTGRDQRTNTHVVDSPATASVSESIDAIVNLLAEAGLVPERPRALLLEGAAPKPSRLTRIRPMMEHARDADEAAYLARTRELAFLANTLMAGCAVQSRPFTAPEASDAAIGTCNLGLEHLAGRDTRLPGTFLVDHDLMTVFEIGWTVLHEDVCMFVAERLIETLTDLRCVDPDIQSGIHALRRALVRQREAGTPWHARDTLEVIAMLDAPAWASLLGLLNECPVLPAALTATLERRKGAISATAFEFISTTDQIGQVRAFMEKLPDMLVR
jgi:hypothetical protein